MIECSIVQSACFYFIFLNMFLMYGVIQELFITLYIYFNSNKQYK